MRESHQYRGDSLVTMAFMFTSFILDAAQQSPHGIVRFIRDSQLDGSDLTLCNWGQ